MKQQDAIELAAYKAALELKKAQLGEAKSQNEELRASIANDAVRIKAEFDAKLQSVMVRQEQFLAEVSAKIVPPPPEPKAIVTEREWTAWPPRSYPLTNPKFMKAGPDPRVIRDALLTAIQKGLIQRLKKFFQGLQLQALRILRAETGETEVDRPYWDEGSAAAELSSIIETAYKEVGQAAFAAASKEYNVPVPWTAANFWLPQYTGVRAELIKGIDENLKAELIAELKEGYQLGEGIPQLSQRVTEVFRDAIDWKAERIARTETIQAYAAASLAAYQAGGIEKILMYDGPHDDKANCIDVDGMVVSLTEAIQLMAAEHPNGIRGVAPFMEQLLAPEPQKQAAQPDLMSKFFDMFANEQKANREFMLLMADRMTPPDVKFEFPNPPPIHVNFGEGAIKSSTTIAEGAIQAAPVTFAEGSIKPEVVVNNPVTIAEGAVKVDSPVTIEEVRVEAPIFVQKGAVESNTPITVMMPEAPEVVVNIEDEEPDAASD